MEQNTARIALVVGDRRVDVAVPARRPVAEYLPQLVDLADPTERMAAGWHLVRVGGALLDPERSLAESSVVDGELIHLAPALAAPNGADLVDDLPAAVATAAVPHPGAPSPRRAAGHLFHALAAAVGVGLSLSLAAGGTAGGALAAVTAVAMLAAATLLRVARREVEASIWAFTAIVPAGVAGWVLGRSAEVWWVPVVVAAALAAVAAAVAVPVRQAVLVPLAAGLVGAAAWCVVFATATREPGAIGGPAVILGFLLIDVVPRVAFHALGVGRLHRGSPTAKVVDDRVRRARLTIVAGNVLGGVLVVIGSAALAAGSDPWGWALAAAGGFVLALHTRLYTNLDEMVPVAAAAVGVYLLLVTLTVLPEAGWPFAALASAVLAAGLALVGMRPRPIRPLTRRRLARAEAICALPLVLAALISSGLAETLYRSGQNLT